MSIEASQMVWQRSEQTGGLKLTLLALADYCRPENGLKCWPSIPTLADMVGCSERQIKRNLAKLEEAGELIILRNVGRSNTNMYDLSPLNSDTHDTIYQEEKVTSEAEKVTSEVIKGDTHDTQTVISVKQPLLTDDAGFADAVKAYENEIGILGHMVGDKIAAAVDEFGAGHVVEAIGIAADNNVRKWSYVDGILKRWRANGKQPARQRAEAAGVIAR